MNRVVGLAKDLLQKTLQRSILRVIALQPPLPLHSRFQSHHSRASRYHLPRGLQSPPGNHNLTSCYLQASQTAISNRVYRRSHNLKRRLRLLLRLKLKLSRRHPPLAICSLSIFIRPPLHPLLPPHRQQPRKKTSSMISFLSTRLHPKHQL